MLDVYQKVVRSIMELVAAAWNDGINKRKSKDRLHKCTFYIILGNRYQDCNDALEITNKPLHMFTELFQFLFRNMLMHLLHFYMHGYVHVSMPRHIHMSS